MNPEVLTQAFLARALPIFHEVLLNAIRNFHFEQYPTNAVLAGMGSVLALAMYYFLDKVRSLANSSECRASTTITKEFRSKFSGRMKLIERF